MVDRPWLVRTKTNHILGPYRKDELLQLLGEGKVLSDDEVCSGNGYWFFLREDELVNRYLKGDEPQSFNPVSEAESMFPVDSERPTANLETHTIEKEEIAPPITEKRRELPPRIDKRTEKKMVSRGGFFSWDKLIFFLGVLFLAMAIVIFVFRKKILNDYIHLSLVNSAFAQDIHEHVKKKI